MNSKQIKCVQMLAAGELSQKEIAEKLRVSQQTICNWKKSTEFLSAYDEQIKANIRSLAGLAFKTQKDLLVKSKQDNVRLAAAKDILDRGGYKNNEEEKDSTVSIIFEDGDSRFAN